MRLYRSLRSLPATSGGDRRVATIGAFDGLHRGHQEIVMRVVAEARSEGMKSIVISFEPTPAEYFAGDDPPARLTCFRERVEHLARLGVEELLCPRFETVKPLSAETFVEEVLVGRLGTHKLVVGHDFRFGAGRGGSPDRLRALGRELGFEVETVAPIEVSGLRVSSTEIRAALARGDLDAARLMLGRDYSMSGRVVHGRGLGKDLGFPTANVNLKRRLAPVDGIFAVRVRGLGAGVLDGVASVGSRPTIGGGETLLEVFIFDFDDDIYGRYITVEFIERLREERKFPDMASMQEQMRRDADRAQAALRQRIA